jgi:hypothetical protein
MMRVIAGSSFVLVALALCLPLGGCVVAADLFNPDALLSLGLDPSLLQSPPGTIIVAFNNTTRNTAAMQAFASQSAVDPTINSRNFAVQVDAGETRNEVLSCPVGALAPGSLADDFSFEALAATVFEEDGTTTVDYNGPVLEFGTSYLCGDVIEIRLTAVTTGEETGYAIIVRVIRGQ